MSQGLAITGRMQGTKAPRERGLTSRDKQRQETRERLYQVALAVFRREGVAECKIDDIAREARVSRGTFYFHFPSKDDVLLERLHASELVVAARIAKVAVGASLAEVLASTCAALAAEWGQEPELLPEVATVALRFYAKRITERSGQPVRATLSPHFRAAADRGELITLLPAEVLSDFFLANALSAMLAWVGSPSLELEQVLTGVAGLFLNGARATP